jgi:hypothetical protein
MITEDEVEKTVDWLRDNAKPAAKARAERLYVEAYVKTVLAQEAEESGAQSQAAKEQLGRISPRYMATLQAFTEAVEADESHRFLREAASAKIEAWRTMESTRRAEGKAYS